MQSSSKPAPLLVSQAEAARMLCMSVRSLFNLTAPRGPIPCVKLGSRILFDVDDLRGWIDEQKVTSSVQRADERESVTQPGLAVTA